MIFMLFDIFRCMSSSLFLSAHSQALVSYMGQPSLDYTPSLLHVRQQGTSLGIESPHFSVLYFY